MIDLLLVDDVIDELSKDRVYGNVYEACADRIPGAQAPDKERSQG